MKRSALARSTKPMKRSRMKQRRPNPERGVEFSDEVKSQVRVRTGNRCEVGLPGCAGRVQHFHHRHRKGQQGKGTLENCVGSCNACHTPGGIHGHPDWAYRHGFMVRNGKDPASIGIHHGCDLTCRLNHCDDTRGRLSSLIDEELSARLRESIGR